MESNGCVTNSTIKTCNHIKQHCSRELQDHPNIIECHNNISNMYKCKNCDFATNLKVSLKLHFDLNHKEDRKNQNHFINVMRQCGFCDFQTFSSLLLLKHYLKCDKRENVLTDETFDGITWLECGQCPFKTKDEDSLRRHAENLHSTNFTSFQCENCPFNTESEHNMLQHIRLKHSNVESITWFKCDKCSYQTQVEIYFRKHTKAHNKDSIKIMWHQCDKCDFKTKWKNVLKKHLATLHTDLENRVWYKYKCDKCDFKTKWKNVLNKHLATLHTDRENRVWYKYKCDKCDFKTKWKKVLKKHLATLHTDLENSVWCKCDKCDYKTKWKNVLNKHHAKLHRALKNRVWHKCDKCDFTTKLKKVLKKHLATLHTDLENRVWYKCDKCEYKTEREDHLQQHITNLHQTKVREIVRKNEDVVNFLLEISGSSNLSDDDLYFLKQLDRPTPSLNNLLNINANSSNRRFCTSWYQKCNWLTGSEVKNKLYCWPCLLFPSNSKSPWHTTGFDNMKSLSRSVERHELSRDHIYSILKYKLFGANNIQNSLDSKHRDSVLRLNEKVKENRDILRRLIEMTIYLATEELTFREHSEKDDSQNKGNFRELAEFLSIYDSKFEEFLKSSSVFSKISKTVQNDLIDSINHVLLESIESEISNSVCFSWEIDETADISSQSQLSVVFRFTHEGDIVERFLGFFDVAAGRTADDLFNFLSLRFKQFNFKDKLIGQSYDGASVISSDLIELQSRIKTIAPQALFTHCHAHRLNLILQDSVSSIRECKIFFATLSGISAFFSKSTKSTNVLDEVCKQRAPRSNAQTSWNFKSQVVNTVLTYRKELLEAFEKITRSSDFANDWTSIRESACYIDFLNNFDNLFLLNVFSIIFQQTDLISSIIQSQSDILYCKFQVENILGRIHSFRNDELKFRYIYESTVNVLGIPPKTKSNLPHLDNDVTLHYKRLYYQLLDSIIAQIQDRFIDFDKLQIFELLNSNKFAAFDNYFPMDLLNLLVNNYPKLFNKDKLEIELKILYSEKTILGESSELRDMLKLMTVNSLQDVVPELFKLLSLILSLPATSASVGGSPSVLERIKNYARNTSLSNLSLIAIEREMVKSLRKSPNFFDRVIDHFAQSKDREIELIYKKL